MSEQRTPPRQPVRRHGPMGGPGGGMMPGEKAKNFKGSFKRLLSYFKPQKGILSVVLVMALFSVGCTVAGPKILERGLNQLIEALMGHFQAGLPMDFGPFGTTLLIMLGIYALSAAFGFVQQRIMAVVSRNIIYNMRRQVDKKLSRLPLSYYDGTTRGEILSRVTNDIDNIGSTLQQNLTQIVTAVFTLIGVLIMMFTIDVKLTFLCLATLPVVFIATALIMKRSQKHFAAQWAATGTLNSHIEEMYTGHNIVRVFGREKETREVFLTENEKLYGSSYKAQFISGIIMPLMFFLNNLNFIIICVIGGVQVAGNPARFGSIQAMIQYARQFTQPIQQTASIANVLQSTVASAERVFELLDEKEELPDPQKPLRLEGVKGHVGFDHVSFRYNPEVPLIDDINLDVQPGRKVAIVGPTGAGKTTVVNLLMRFYELGGGAITVDGTDIRELTRDNLRDQFGMVLQDTWLFSGTIRDNIAYGRHGASEEEIVAAAKAASVDHFVRTLEHGYDTVIEDEATNISQGQRQLLTIARAFLSDPRILILDEATSSVDTRTEILIQRAMEKLMENRTSFVIAHRLSTIKNADIILVMRDGAIVEQGNHDALLAKNGFYAELYNSQFTRT